MISDEEKKQRMIDKAIDKLGISKDLVDKCCCPVSRIIYGGNKHVCEFKEQGVCLILKGPDGCNTMSQLALLVFGLEDSDVPEKD